MNFSELLQGVYDALGSGVTKGLIATGGGLTTIIDTTLSDDYQTDHFKNYYAFVVRDAGGASAAPQGEFELCTAYNESTKTLTVDTYTVAVAAGDEILLTKPSPFGLGDVKRLCNTALKELGGITRYDTSLTAVSTTKEYTIPVAVRVPLDDVWILPTGADDYVRIEGCEVQQGAAGATWKLIIPTGHSGTLKLAYKIPHPALVDYDDVVEDIPAPLAIAVCAWTCATWKAKNDATWKETANELQQKYESARLRFPIPRHQKRTQGMPHW